MSDTEPQVVESTKPPKIDASVITIDTADLFAGRTEIRLMHQGTEYRLRITKLGKLILTK